MSAIIFDGRSFAYNREIKLRTKLEQARLQLRMGSLVFMEDQAGAKYTQLKKQAAARVGIEFSEEYISIREPLVILQQKVQDFFNRDDFHGVMIQKPSQTVFESALGGGNEKLTAWWGHLANTIPIHKDIDCLHPHNLNLVMEGKWKVLPATVKAIVSVLYQAHIQGQVFQDRTEFHLHNLLAVVIGRSDIVGLPLSAVLAQYGAQVALYGRDLDLTMLGKADLVVAATGVENLVGGEMVKPGVVLVDCGFPIQEINQQSVIEKAKFLTPVPNGIGPVTVVSVLENLYTCVMGK